MVWTADNIHLCDVRGFGHLTGTGGLHLSDKLACEIQDGWGRQIAEALNADADKDRQIAVLTKALDHYADESLWDDPHPDLEYAKGSFYNYVDEFDGLIPGYDIAQNALAESKRIQEGENEK